MPSQEAIQAALSQLESGENPDPELAAQKAGSLNDDQIKHALGALSENDYNWQDPQVMAKGNSIDFLPSGKVMQRPVIADDMQVDPFAELVGMQTGQNSYDMRHMNQGLDNFTPQGMLDRFVHTMGSKDQIVRHLKKKYPGSRYVKGENGGEYMMVNNRDDGNYSRVDLHGYDDLIHDDKARTLAPIAQMFIGTKGGRGLNRLGKSGLQAGERVLGKISPKTLNNLRKYGKEAGSRIKGSAFMKGDHIAPNVPLLMKSATEMLAEYGIIGAGRYLAANLKDDMSWNEFLKQLEKGNEVYERAPKIDLGEGSQIIDPEEMSRQMGTGLAIDYSLGKALKLAAWSGRIMRGIGDKVIEKGSNLAGLGKLDPNDREAVLRRLFSNNAEALLDVHSVALDNVSRLQSLKDEFPEALKDFDMTKHISLSDVINRVTKEGTVVANKQASGMTQMAFGNDNNLLDKFVHQNLDRIHAMDKAGQGMFDALFQRVRNDDTRAAISKMNEILDINFNSTRKALYDPLARAMDAAKEDMDAISGMKQAVSDGARIVKRNTIEPLDLTNVVDEFKKKVTNWSSEGGNQSDKVRVMNQIIKNFSNESGSKFESMSEVIDKLNDMGKSSFVAQKMKIDKPGGGFDTIDLNGETMEMVNSAKNALMNEFKGYMKNKLSYTSEKWEYLQKMWKDTTDYIDYMEAGMSGKFRRTKGNAQGVHDIALVDDHFVDSYFANKGFVDSTQASNIKDIFERAMKIPKVKEHLEKSNISADKATNFDMNMGGFRMQQIMNQAEKLSNGDSAGFMKFVGDNSDQMTKMINEARETLPPTHKQVFNDLLAHLRLGASKANIIDSKSATMHTSERANFVPSVAWTVVKNAEAGARESDIAAAKIITEKLFDPSFLKEFFKEMGGNAFKPGTKKYEEALIKYSRKNFMDDITNFSKRKYDTMSKILKIMKDSKNPVEKVLGDTTAGIMDAYNASAAFRYAALKNENNPMIVGEEEPDATAANGSMIPTRGGMMNIR